MNVALDKLASYAADIEAHANQSPLHGSRDVLAVATPRTKIAIVGTAPSREEAPFGDPSWEIWACSAGNAGGQLPRVDRWCEIHGDLEWEQYKQYHDPYLKWLNEQSFPVWTQEAFRRLIPRAEAFPIDKLVAEFGSDWFTSTIAMLQAQAIMQLRPLVASGLECAIGLYGIDMSHDTEYATQKPACQFFISMAAGHGIRTVMPAQCELRHGPPIYGYFESDPTVTLLSGRKFNLTRKKELLQTQVAALDAEILERNQRKNHHAAEMYFLDGAIDDINYMLRTVVCKYVK